MHHQFKAGEVYFEGRAPLLQEIVKEIAIDQITNNTQAVTNNEQK
jgi:hypothetical protein